MSFEEKILKCERALEGNDVDEAYFETRTVARCRAKIDALVSVVERLCLDAKDRAGLDNTFSVAVQIDGVLSAVDAVNKALKAVGRQLPAETAKELAEVRKGPFKAVLASVTSDLEHEDRIRNVAVPILKLVVSALSELNASLEA